jgi:hypothetical protein
LHFVDPVRTKSGTNQIRKQQVRLNKLTNFTSAIATAARSLLFRNRILSTMMLTRTLPTLALLMSSAPLFAQAQSITLGNDSSSALPKEGNDNRSLLLRDLTSSSSCRADRLRECDYDCIQDCDCKDGLVCYQRDNDSNSKYFHNGGRRDHKIPGCSHTKARNYHVDYCINPSKFPTKTLWHIGSDGGSSKGKHELLYPLQECWGDCDKDEDWYVPVYILTLPNAAHCPVCTVLYCTLSY